MGHILIEIELLITILSGLKGIISVKIELYHYSSRNHIDFSGFILPNLYSLVHSLFDS